MSLDKIDETPSWCAFICIIIICYIKNTVTRCFIIVTRDIIIGHVVSLFLHVLSLFLHHYCDSLCHYCDTIVPLCLDFIVTLLLHFVTLLWRFVTLIRKIKNIFPFLKCRVVKVRHGQDAAPVSIFDRLHLKSEKSKTVLHLPAIIWFIIK